ncbi:MAG: hypothetical protein ACI8RD_005232 [Bacillariaceae sp.]|jgi:hypothetical protein
MDTAWRDVEIDYNRSMENFGNLGGMSHSVNEVERGMRRKGLERVSETIHTSIHTYITHAYCIVQRQLTYNC